MATGQVNRPYHARQSFTSLCMSVQRDVAEMDAIIKSLHRVNRNRKEELTASTQLITVYAKTAIRHANHIKDFE